MPGKAGIFSSILRIPAMISIHDPIQVKTPNKIKFSGIKSIVIAVIIAPNKNTVKPLRNKCRLIPEQKPDNKINVQQMHCCQIYAG